MVAEKYAIAEDLNEIIAGDQKEEKRGYDADAIPLPGSDIKKTRHHSDHHGAQLIPILTVTYPAD